MNRLRPFKFGHHRRTWQWIGTVVLSAALLTTGCGGQGGSETVVVTALTPAATAVPASPSPVPSSTVSQPLVGPSAAAGVASASASPPAEAGQKEIEPVVGGVSGSGDAGLGDVPVGPAPVGGVLAGPGDSRGGLAWGGLSDLEKGHRDRVYDLCDEGDAFFAANRRALEPGEEPAGEERIQMGILLAGRRDDGLSCEAGGRRYMCYSALGYFHPVTATRDEADALCKSDAEAMFRSIDYALGLFAPGQIVSLEWPAGVGDDVVVLRDTVSVVGGTVRGLVHNRSKTLFARQVAVAAPAEAGGGVWRWPLTVQPGERAPFEIDGWAGSADPAAVALGVSAELTPYIDISRSFIGGVRHIESGDAGTYRYMADLFPGLEQQDPTGASPEFETFILSMGVKAPDSHPSLAEAVMGQTVLDLRAYAAFLDDNGKVVDVIRTFPHHLFTGYDQSVHQGRDYVVIDRLPMDPPTGTPKDSGFDIWFILEHDDFYLWVGGANPPPAGPPVLEPADPPPRTPAVPLPGD